MTYANATGRTSVRSLFETGALRLRHPRGADCHALVVNTGGAIVAGDALLTDISLEPSAKVMMSSVAAEKIYRSEGPTSTVATRMKLGAGARLAWLPHETILFDHARLDRRFVVDLSADANLVACEMVQFGRLAFGEQATHGLLRESWRIRRDGRLIHADESRIDGVIGRCLDRSAVAANMRAAATFVLAGPDVHDHKERLEAVLAVFRSPGSALEGGVSAKDGILLARLLARSASDLRPCIAATVQAVPGLFLPRSWH